MYLFSIMCMRKDPFTTEEFNRISSDSYQVFSKKILLGDLRNSDLDPLSFYRNQLSRMDNPVKIINFEDLSFGPKIGISLPPQTLKSIGAGGYGEVYKGGSLRK